MEKTTDGMADDGLLVERLMAGVKAFYIRMINDMICNKLCVSLHYIQQFIPEDTNASYYD